MPQPLSKSIEQLNEHQRKLAQGDFNDNAREMREVLAEFAHAAETRSTTPQEADDLFGRSCAILDRLVNSQDQIERIDDEMRAAS